MTVKQSDTSGQQNPSVDTSGLKVVTFKGTENAQFDNLFLIPGNNVFMVSMLEKLQAHSDYPKYSELIEIKEFDTLLIK